MTWILVDKTRLRPGILHPDDWGGLPVVLHLGVTAMSAMEPLWRQLSVLSGTEIEPERAIVHAHMLFAQTVEHSLPALLLSEGRDLTNAPPASQVLGRLTSPAAIGQVGQAAEILRERMSEPWTTRALADTVALSRTHFTRLFTKHIGLAPMRFLAEVRLTEFTRLIEETDLSLAAAAHLVGWADPRVAAGWFRKRFSIPPSEYRRRPHPTSRDQEGRCVAMEQGRSIAPIGRGSASSSPLNSSHVAHSSPDEPIVPLTVESGPSDA